MTVISVGVALLASFIAVARVVYLSLGLLLNDQAVEPGKDEECLKLQFQACKSLWLVEALDALYTPRGLKERYRHKFAEMLALRGL